MKFIFFMQFRPEQGKHIMIIIFIVSFMQLLSYVASPLCISHVRRFYATSIYCDCYSHSPSILTNQEMWAQGGGKSWQMEIGHKFESKVSYNLYQ